MSHPGASCNSVFPGLITQKLWFYRSQLNLLLTSAPHGSHWRSSMDDFEKYSSKTWCFKNFNLHTDDPGALLKRGFWFSSSRNKPENPHFKKLLDDIGAICSQAWRSKGIKENRFHVFLSLWIETYICYIIIWIFKITLCMMSVNSLARLNVAWGQAAD